MAFGTKGAVSISSSDAPYCVELERAIELRRVGIDQQFGAIETVTGPRLEWAVRAQAVAGAGADAHDMPIKHIAQSPGHLDPRGFGPGHVKKRNEYCLGAARRDGEIDPGPVRGRAKRLGLASTDVRR
jgi:hypothetical protein